MANAGHTKRLNELFFNIANAWDDTRDLLLATLLKAGLYSFTNQ